MDSMRKWMLAGLLCLGGFTTISVIGCGHYHHHEEWVDEHGYHHEGYRDNHNVWHGGYTDERGDHHDDPGDWHH